VAWLRLLIVDGELRPGDRVNQEELAERAGVSLAPVREALRVLEQEGQVTYRPRRGYFVTELSIADLREIYDLRRVLEERAARTALAEVDDDALARIKHAAAECAEAARTGDVLAGLAANRRFHFAILATPSLPHTMRVLRMLWESTEAYRAIYYNSSAEREATVEAHTRIVHAIVDRDAERLIVELNRHRERGLDVLSMILGQADEDQATPPTARP
jgi:DNA-binding GntR family transcriptional regulator